MTTKTYIFDADQLSFKKLDDDNITWVTIRGNHVPIPKGGTREQKSQAIREWFASKKKELPQAKGRISFYSAKVEHDVPKKTARGTGEQAQVHGEGQYTLKFARNNYENYFKKFRLTKTVQSSLTPREKTELHGWASRILGGLGSIEKAKKDMAFEISKAKHDIESAETRKKEFAELSNMSKEEAEKVLNDPELMKKYDIPEHITTANEFWQYANNNSSILRDEIKRTTEWMQNTESASKNLQKYLDQGKFWEESGMYTVGEKIYKKDESRKNTLGGMRYQQVHTLYKMPVEERKKAKEDEIAKNKKDIDDRKEHLEALKNTKGDTYWERKTTEEEIKLLERELSWWEKLDVENIKPAKAQMSKVELPATKTYLREYTNLRGQSNYVKQNIKRTLVDEYKVNELRDYGLNDIADEFESIIDDAVGLNSNNSSGSHIEFLLNQMPSKVKYDLETDKPKTMPFVDPEKQKKLERVAYLVENISDKLRTTLLAKNDDDSLVINNGRGLYTKLGRYIANEKSKSYWGASERQGQLAASTALSKHDISGIAYTGHGRSRISGYTDSEGNVTFDPSKIKVLEKTTDPAIIEEWIKRQESNQKQKGKQNAKLHAI